MKLSPNANSSMTLLRTAQRAIRHAWEDLKNDESVRKAAIHSDLQDLELKIGAAEQRLIGLSYPSAIESIPENQGTPKTIDEAIANGTRGRNLKAHITDFHAQVLGAAMMSCRTPDEEKIVREICKRLDVKGSG